MDILSRNLKLVQSKKSTLYTCNKNPTERLHSGGHRRWTTKRRRRTNRPKFKLRYVSTTSKWGTDKYEKCRVNEHMEWRNTTVKVAVPLRLLHLCNFFAIMAVTTFPIPNSGIRCPPGTSQVHSCDRYFVDVVVVVVPGHRDRAPNNRSTQGMGTTRQGRRVKSNSTENLAPLLWVPNLSSFLDSLSNQIIHIRDLYLDSRSAF